MTRPFAKCALFLATVCFVAMAGVFVQLAAPTDSAWARSTHHAILVGEEKYSGTDYLRGAHNDVARMGSALKHLEGDPYDVVTLKDVSKSKVLSTIRSFQPGGSRAAAGADTTLFYFSGHGMSGAKSSPSKNGGLCCMNSSGDITTSQIITAKELSAELKKVRGHIVIILDSCYSGEHVSQAKSAGVKLMSDDEPAPTAASSAEANEAVDDFMSAFEGQTLSTSSSGSNVSLMASEAKFNVLASSSRTTQSMTFSATRNGKKVYFGLFTYQLLNSAGFGYVDSAFITDVTGDKNNDRMVTVNEAFGLASKQVEKYAPSMNSQVYPKSSSLVLFNRSGESVKQTEEAAPASLPPVLKAQNTAVAKPLATSIKKLKRAKRQFTVTWKKVTTSNVRGYQIRYSVKKSMAKAKTKVKTVKNAKTSKLKVKKLKRGKKYYVQVRTYSIVNGKTIYSSWSSKKSVRVK